MPGNLALTTRLRNGVMPVSIRRADHYAWELYMRESGAFRLAFQSAGRITIPGNYVTMHTNPQSFWTCFNPPGGSRYLGTKIGAHANRQVRGMCFNPPGGSRYLGTSKPGLMMVAIMPFQSAGRITIPGNLCADKRPDPPCARFNPPGGSRYLGTPCLILSTNYQVGFNPPGGSRYLGTSSSDTP